jgi:hypothetical protein
VVEQKMERKGWRRGRGWTEHGADRGDRGGDRGKMIKER